MEERESRCESCGRAFRLAAGPGRPRRYCRRSCRQRAYERRARDGELDWSGEQYRRLAATLAEHEDALDRIQGVLDELRRDLADDLAIDGEELLDRLDAALR